MGTPRRDIPRRQPATRLGGDGLLFSPLPSHTRVYTSRPPTQLRLACARDTKPKPKPTSPLRAPRP
eukprot:3478844-Pyramimonas_sp.AAC.1